MVALALLVVLAPVSSAATIVSFSAPYTGFAVTTANYTYSYGCGSSHTVGTPSWSNATGTFNAIERATLGGCAGYSYSDSYAFTELTGPTFSPARGATPTS
jgi:hypothetical protein